LNTQFGFFGPWDVAAIPLQLALARGHQDGIRWQAQKANDKEIKPRSKARKPRFTTAIHSGFTPKQHLGKAV
jgi:hypothetical protein